MKKTITPLIIVERYRQNGNSTWILKSAIENPKCIIVSYNKANAEGLKLKYFEMLKNLPWWKRWKHKVYPKFLSLNDNFDGYNLPIIFDNSALFQ
jgi:hypothetical protein